MSLTFLTNSFVVGTNAVVPFKSSVSFTRPSAEEIELASGNLQESVDFLNRCFSSSKISNNHIFSWLESFQEEIKKVVLLIKSVNFNNQEQSLLKELIMCIRNLESSFLPKVIDEYNHWLRASRQLMLLGQIVNKNLSPFIEALSVSDLETTHESESSSELRILFSDLLRPEVSTRLEYLVSRVKNNCLSSIAQNTITIIDSAYNLLSLDHPLRLQVAYDLVKAYQARITYLEEQPSSASIVEELAFYKAKIANEQKIVLASEERMRLELEEKLRLLEQEKL